MNPSYSVKTVVPALCLTFLALPVQGAEVAGIKFSETYVADRKILRLAGTGLLRYWDFKAYSGALHLEKGSPVDEVLSDRTKRIELEYCRAIKGDDFGPAADKFIAKTYERLRLQIEFHNSLYEDVQPGDRYSFTYIPGRGTEPALNVEPKGIIEGSEFAAAAFLIWLGPKPINNSSKK